MLAVRPSRRKQGVATALVSALFKHALLQKVQWGSLYVAPSNTAALGLYQKVGFCQDGVVEDYYAPGVSGCALYPDISRLD
jgi:ribosomal-protein-alanine N-acetyltransferase